MSSVPRLGKFFNKALYELVCFRYGFNSITEPLVWPAIFQRAQLRKKYPHPEKLKVFHMYPASGVIPVELQDYLHPHTQLLMDHTKKNVSFYENNMEPVVQKLNKKITLESVAKKTDDADTIIEKKNRKRQLFELPSSLIEDDPEKKVVEPINFIHVAKDPFIWESFTSCVEDNTFVPETEARDHIHKTFLAFGNYTNLTGEGLAVQHINCFVNKNWIQRYGRVRVIMVVTDHTAGKMLGERLGKPLQTRMSLNTKTFSDVKLLAITRDSPEVSEKTISEHSAIVIDRQTLFGKTVTKGLAVVELSPKILPEDLNLDHFDYVTKQLFFRANCPLKESVELLGFGAYQFFENEPEFKEIEHIKTHDMTPDQFFTVTRLFGYWPFKPEVLLSFEEDKVDTTKR